MPAPVRREQLSADLPLGSTKDPCRLATTANDTLSGLAARDGVTPVANDRVLVKNQSTASQNGIYLAAAGGWTRTIDFDDDSDADPGTLIPVAEGTANGDTLWQLATDAPITVGSTALTFSIIGRAGVDPGAHGTDHDPGGSDAATTAAAVGINADSTNTEGSAASFARSDHTHDPDTAGGTISTVNAGDAAAEGAGTGFSRRDHQHSVATAAAGAIEPDDAAAEGVSSSLSRADHTHSVVAAAPAQGVGGGNTEGSATSFARSDHDHTIRTTSGPTDLTVASIADGQLVERSGTTLAGITAIDDTQHGNRGGGSLHAAATPSVNGFMSASDKTKLDSLQDAAGIDAKESCRVRTQGNITLSGEQTIDGILTAADRVLVTEQTTATEDGIYLSAAGAWTRTGDAPTGAESRGWTIPTEEGTVDGDKIFQVLNNEGSDIIGTDGLTVGAVSGGSPRGAGAGLILSGNDLDVVANADGSMVINADDIQVGVLATDAQHGVRGGGTQHANAVAAGAAGFMTGADKTKLDNIETGATAEIFRQEAVTTETITNTDTALSDTLNNTPKSDASLVLALNGIQQKQGAGFDYSISGSTITWLASTGTAVNMKTTDTLDATYVS